MGDAGSTMLGLIVVWLTISVCQGEARQISPVVGLWFVLVPVADFFSCFVQRIARGKSPLSHGREHFHHTLLHAGMSSRQVVGTLTGAALIYAGAGLFGVAVDAPDWVMFSLWMTVLVSHYWIVKALANRFMRKSMPRQTPEICSD